MSLSFAPGKKDRKISSRRVKTRRRRRRRKKNPHPVVIWVHSGEKKGYFKERSKSRKFRGMRPAFFSALPSPSSTRGVVGLGLVLGVFASAGRAGSVADRRGAHGGPRGQRRAVTTAEEPWGRFRRLCNLTHSLRRHGSDEQSVLLPKLISPTRLPPPPPFSLSTSCGADCLDLFIYANSSGWGAWCVGPSAPTRPPRSPSSALLVPFEVTLGAVYRQEGGVEWNWGCPSLPFPGFTPRTLFAFHRNHRGRHHSAF